MERKEVQEENFPEGHNILNISIMHKQLKEYTRKQHNNMLWYLFLFLIPWLGHNWKIVLQYTCRRAFNFWTSNTFWFQIWQGIYQMTIKRKKMIFAIFGIVVFWTDDSNCNFWWSIHAIYRGGLKIFTCKYMRYINMGYGKFWSILGGQKLERKPLFFEMCLSYVLFLKIWIFTHQHIQNRKRFNEYDILYTKIFFSFWHQKCKTVK